MSRRLRLLVFPIAVLLDGSVLLSPWNLRAQLQQPYVIQTGSAPVATIASARKESPNFAAAATFLEDMGYRLVLETSTIVQSRVDLK